MVLAALVETVIEGLGKCFTQEVTYKSGYKVKRIYWPKFSTSAPWDIEVLHDPRKKDISKV